ncbi:hypothetical protein Bbelb_118730 [Branchiostoma belcheri]|nr:hypothetical protein Bbelb_118730 [Branchiostoma belcheri]
MAGPGTSGFWRWMVLVLMVTAATVNGQECPIAGYVGFKRFCYKAFTELKNYTEAGHACAADGGLLAMPKDSATNTFIYNLAGGPHRWIGLTDIDSEGQWLFADGQTLASTGYTNWNTGEPNAYYPNEDCVEVLDSALWNDDPCDRPKAFVCQIAIVCPIAGYDNFNGVCYKAFAEMKNYTQASQTCAADGGLLAMPKNDMINAFIHNLLPGNESRWIGLTDAESEGQWIFADGQTLASSGYANWAPGEPNHFYPNENCAEIYVSGRWNDDPCNRAKGFICQVALGTGQTVYDAWSANGRVLHNKCPVVDQWGSLNVQRVKVVLESEGENVELIFDGTNTDKFNWFSKSRLLSSPWNDIDTEPQNYFSIEGAPQFKRSFYINRNWGGCPHDVGWLVVADGGPYEICPWEQVPEDQLPYIRYSNTGYNANLNGDGFATADRMVIYLDTPGNDVLCSCPDGQGLSKDGTRCEECTQNATCTGFGDPHYTTFDGTTYEFQGPCRYTLAKDCGSSNDFNIEVQQVPPSDNPTVSYVREVYVKAYGYEIGMLPDNVVTVKGPTSMNAVTATPSFTIDQGKINVTLSGTFVRVELTELCVVILYSGADNYRVEVKIPSSYQNRMCGLCGNYNNMGTDDFVMPNGNIAPNVDDFGNSWETDSNTCTAGTSTRRKRQTEELCDSNYSDPCNALKDPNGTFAVCHGVFDPQVHFESCVFDTCATQGQGWFLCGNLREYYHSCISSGVSPFTWRTPDLCPMDCPANSTYSTCASACPATCANPNAPDTCNYACLEGCECDPGYVQSGLNCVRPADCGCTSNDGFYYTLGAVWEDNGECVCHTGNTIVCEEILSALTLVDAGIGHLTVSWTVQGRLPISRYRLRYQPADGSGSYQDLSPAPGPDATSATVQGLYADTDYILTLTSFGVYDQPTGEINGTYTTDSVVVNVVCDQDSMSLSIPRAALPAVNVEDLHLLDPDCGATEDEDVFKFETHLQECGTRQETSGDDKFIFSNAVIANQVTYDNGAVRGQPVKLPFHCEFLRQRNVSGGAIMYNIPSPRIQIVDGNNSFTIEMHMFTSEDFLATYESSDFPIKVSPSDRLHFGLSVASPLDNLELFARDCVSTPTTSPDDYPRVSIIDDGCQVDQTLQKDNERSNDKALYYSVDAFTFPNALDPSLVYFHCTMIICFKDDPDSRCKQGCIPPAARRRRAVSDGTEGRVRRESSRDKRADITQGPFQVQSGQEAGTGPAGVPLGTAVGAAVGVAGIMVLLIVAGVLVKKRGGLALGRKKRDDDTVGLDNYAYQSWGKMSKAGIADTKA